MQGGLIDTVDLGERDDLRLFRETAAIGFEFAAHDFIGLARMSSSGIDKVGLITANLEAGK